MHIPEFGCFDCCVRRIGMFYNDRCSLWMVEVRLLRPSLASHPLTFTCCQCLVLQKDELRPPPTQYFHPYPPPPAVPLLPIPLTYARKSSSQIRPKGVQRCTFQIAIQNTCNCSARGSGGIMHSFSSCQLDYAKCREWGPKPVAKQWINRHSDPHTCAFLPHMWGA